MFSRGILDKIAQEVPTQELTAEQVIEMVKKTPGWKVVRPGRFTLHKRVTRLYPPGSTGWVVEGYLVVGEPVRLIWTWNQKVEELIEARRLTLIPRITWDTWNYEMWVDSKPVLEVNGIKTKTLILEEQVVELPIPLWVYGGETTYCLISEVGQLIGPFRRHWALLPD